MSKPAINIKEAPININGIIIAVHRRGISRLNAKIVSIREGHGVLASGRI